MDLIKQHKSTLWFIAFLLLAGVANALTFTGIISFEALMTACNYLIYVGLGALSGQCGDQVNYTFDPVTGVVNITGSGPMWDYDSSSHSPFYQNTAVTSVTIADGVTSIGGYVFYGCASLTNITITNSVTSIGNYVFYGCTGLTSLTIPSSVTSIGSFAFEDCWALASATIHNALRPLASMYSTRLLPVSPSEDTPALLPKLTRTPIATSPSSPWSKCLPLTSPSRRISPPSRPRPSRAAG